MKTIGTIFLGFVLIFALIIVIVVLMDKNYSSMSQNVDYKLSNNITCDYYIPNWGNPIYKDCSDGNEHLNPSDVIRILRTAEVQER